MTVYVDTSALVPLLIDEAASPVCTELWETADRLVSIRLVEIETAAALHRAYRMERIDQPDLVVALTGLDEFMTDLDLVEIDVDLVRLARQCVQAAPLRGYDALHCAAGWVTSHAPDAVLASGDGQLLEAWRNLGGTVLDINDSAG